jgi:hypothetical protein
MTNPVNGTRDDGVQNTETCRQPMNGCTLICFKLF